MWWLSFLFNRFRRKPEPEPDVAVATAAPDGSIASYLDVIATNLETAALATRRIAQRLREARQEMEDLDG